MQTTLLNETGAEMRELFSSIKPADKWTQSFRAVLHRSGTSGEWVTHCENLTATGERKESPDFYWGHYFGHDYTGAVKDYVARCAKYNLLSYVCDHCGSVQHTNENCRG